MRYLLIGNSHAGAVGNSGGALPGAQRDVFVVPGGGSPNLELRDGRLFARRGEVRSNIEGVAQTGLALDGYDFILFSALGPGAIRRAFADYHPFLTTLRADLAVPGAPAAVRASAGFVQAVIYEDVATLKAYHSLQLVARLFPGRILVQPTPMPTESTLDPEEYPIVDLYGDNARHMMAWYGCAVREAIRRAVATLGDNVTMLDYPDPSWVEAGLAPVEYGVPRDPWHMNGSYGALVMEQVRAEMGI